VKATTNKDQLAATHLGHHAVLLVEREQIHVHPVGPRVLHTVEVTFTRFLPNKPLIFDSSLKNMFLKRLYRNRTERKPYLELGLFELPAQVDIIQP
jgi:hypothetical protein